VPSPPAIFPPGWLKKPGFLAKTVWTYSSFISEEGTPAMMALLSRETPISQLGGPAIVSASLRGSDAVLIAGGLVLTEWWLMTRPDIKTAEKLKGGAVAISIFGGLADFLTRIALQKLGLTPVKDVAMIQMSGVPEQRSALEAGKVQGAMLPRPDNFVA
jgi:ABC-type nitrate/sulfonate/bicarbonate transport system substrate-binding protein